MRYLDDALSFEKEDATALDDSGVALVALGRFDEGIARLEHVVEITHRAPHFLGTLGWALATAGREDEARAILEELRGRPPGSPSVVSEIWLLGALGEIDAAFDVVARAEEELSRLPLLHGSPRLRSASRGPAIPSVAPEAGSAARIELRRDLGDAPRPAATCGRTVDFPAGTKTRPGHEAGDFRDA